MAAAMPDHHLHGNFDRCPACVLQQEEFVRRWGRSPSARFGRRRAEIECQLCDGSGHLPLSVAEIVRRTVAVARVHHWGLPA